ncbi:MAG: YqcI/YcgG family protein [Gordonia sp. (in: high G+C Gram-positive bacteria)]
MTEIIEKDTAAEHLDSLTIGGLPGWGIEHGLDILEVITSRQSPFPCTFAVQAARNDGLRFGFVDDLYDESTWDQMRSVLSDYLTMYKSLGRETSLLMFFASDRPDDTMDGYYATFWRILQYLHDGDDVEWPASVALDTDDKMWEFTFEGTPMFVVCCTPTHVTRRSRFSPAFLITFQPQWVFEFIGADTRTGQLARKVIRKRLVAFDGGMEPSPVLGAYGDSRYREWQQYFLPDTDDDPARDPNAGGCPFLHRSRSQPALGSVPAVGAEHPLTVESAAT